MTLFSLKYFLTIDEIKDPEYKLVHQENLTKVYEYQKPLAKLRAIENLVCKKSNSEVLNFMFNSDFDPAKDAVCLADTEYRKKYSLPKIEDVNFSENETSFSLSSTESSYVVLGENFSPMWKVVIDGKELTPTTINYTFQGIEISKGDHKIVWKIKI